jgi:hypothetical protein
MASSTKRNERYRPGLTSLRPAPPLANNMDGGAPMDVINELVEPSAKWDSRSFAGDRRIRSCEMRIATWNLERKKPTSPRGAEAIDHLYAQAADVMVLTEVRTSFPARHGHLLFGEPSTASWLDTDERKVAVWSANVLAPVDVGAPLDPNRFVAARTTTPAGQILVLGVCIPWHMSEVVRHSGPKRKPWEMHL